MATRRKKPQKSDLGGEPDPMAPLNGSALLDAAKPLLKLLSEDLLARADGSPAVTAALQRRHDAERRAERTADSYPEWRRQFTIQVAAAWFLSCVFVRTLEDRGLLGRMRLAGDSALDSQKAFFALAPSLNERDYLYFVFRELARPGTAAEDLFDARHNPVWLLAPSADATKKLLEFFRLPTADAPAFRFGGADTRFLGDLYQDLSEDVRKRYALLQTPRFVEKFILDRTLDRALERFGLNETSLIDPTCGSGHFLLGAFERLFERRLQVEPGIDARQAALKALGAVAGADINPYAVAIARFRLALAFMEKAGFVRLKDVPKLPLHVAVADSLLHNPHLSQMEFGNLRAADMAAWKGTEFALEDPSAARDVLHKQYAAVVGNPPYISVKDPVLRERYRAMYPKSAAGKYSVAAPFTERFFQLARARGYVGMITANSFMKREFGKKLIEEYLPSVNLSLVINTFGAHIPGHGTPTVLLFGSAEPKQDASVLTVLANRGEPGVPSIPEKGLVWSSIAQHWEEIGFENEYISVVRTQRKVLERHPWSLGGGGAVELKELLEERAERILGDLADSVGISAVTGEDDVYLLPPDSARRLSVGRTVPLVTGEFIRDWSLDSAGEVVFPYDDDLRVLDPGQARRELRYLWPYRSVLSKRKRFGTLMLERGLTWFELQELYANKLRTPLTIAFAFVATHNHFVLDRGGKVFKQSAPIIKLPESATEDDHLALLAYLNSSTACFWMKQVFFDKGNQGGERGRPSEPWEAYFEFDSTKLLGLPIPAWSPSQKRELTDLGRKLLELGTAYAAKRSVSDLATRLRSGSEVCDTVLRWTQDLAKLEGMIRALQERLDWVVYEAFGLVQRTPPAREFRAPGERASDVLLAQAVLNGAQGERYFGLCHLGGPTTVLQYETSVHEEIGMIETSPQLRFLENPAFKRTYKDGFRPVDARAAAVEWLLGKIEAVWTAAEVLGGARLLGVLRSDTILCEAVSELLGAEVTMATLSSLVAESAVPYLASQRFTESGLAKFAGWQCVWSLQRGEDAGEQVDKISVPPKYAQDDYRDPIFWRLRSKLDVPKERFISYPGCESDQDGEPLYGWAGWDHLQRAVALAELYQKRKLDEGWTRDRLKPMLAGLLELLPWLKQWHNKPSAELNGARPCDQFAEFLDAECGEHGFTHDDLQAWRPSKGAGSSRRKAGASPRAKATASGDEADS